jgi:RNA polymerase sigma-70 factor (ECF subfamily)
LRSVTREILRSGGDADDCVQEALVAITHALPTFRGDSTILHFCVRIAIRCAMNSRRRSRFHQASRNRVAQLEIPLIAPNAGAGEALDPRRLALLRALLDRLPPRQAETFSMHAVLDYSPSEIASLTGASVNTVRSRIRLARKAMQRHIQADSTLSELFLGWQR